MRKTIARKLPAFTFRPNAKFFIVKPGDLDAAVWCEYCRRWHIHGAHEDETGQITGSGHRVAHCGPRIYMSKGVPVVSPSNSPYTKTGYVLEIVGPASPAILRDIKRRRPRGPAWILAETVLNNSSNSSNSNKNSFRSHHLQETSNEQFTKQFIN